MTGYYGWLLDHPESQATGLGVAFTGDLPRAELLAFARSRRQGSEMRTERYRGVDLARISPRREVYLTGVSIIALILISELSLMV